MTTIEDIASELSDDAANVQLLYAFNSVGKTRLSVAYKNATKNENGTHAASTTTHTARIYLSGTTTSSTVRWTSDSPSSRAVLAGFTPISTNSTSTRS